MATITSEIAPETNAREAILTPSMVALSGMMLCAMSSFYLLLSALPAHAAALGGDLAAGLVTGLMMAATIGGELAAPRFIARIGRRPALAVALMMMATPCLISFSGSLPLVLLGCVARGLGLGVLLVAACGFATLLAPPTRRAEALGVYGVASAIPAIICVPLGPWALAQFGPAPMAVITAALALAGLAGLAMLPRIATRSEDGGHAHSLPALRFAIWPAVSLAIGAVIVGATVTFLPIAHPEAGQGTIMLALLIQGLASATARWAAGRPIDRRGPQGAAIGGVGLALVATALLALPGSVAVIAGMAMSGIAFGVLQSATLAQLMARTTPAQVDGAGALWNGAYDAGLGIGGLAFGVLAPSLGYAASFVITAVGLSLVAFLVFHRFEAQRTSC